MISCFCPLSRACMCQSSTSSFPINSHFCLHLLESLFLVTRRVLILSYVSTWNEQLLLVCLVHSLQHLQSPAWIRHSRNICCLNKQVSLGRRRVSWIYLSIHPSNSLSVCLSHCMIWVNIWASLVAQMVKNLPAMQGTWVWSLGWEDPLEEGMATYSSCLENPMDKRILAGTVHGVEKSRTQLSN